MGYSSIQVSKAMRERLARYKSPGMSYEDVIAVFTAALPSEEFRAAYAAAHARAAKEVVGIASGGDPEQQHRRAHEERARRVANMTPIERMEMAFRLSQIARGDP